MNSGNSSTSRLFISSKYAPLTNITPAQAYLQQNFIYRPSWENNSAGKSATKKTKFGGHLNNKGTSALSFSKSKNKNKNRNVAITSTSSNKTDGKSKRPTTSFDYLIKKEIDSKGGQCSTSKYENRQMGIKEEPISDTEVRNDSESDTDSDSDKKKTSKKSHDKSTSNKSDKNQKSRKSDKSTVNQTDDCSLYDNVGNSDDNSNDSGHNFSGIKPESYQKSNIKNEVSGDSGAQRDDTEAQTTNNTNLDKSSSSVEEFDNEKPSKVVKVNINLDYDSEVYNEEVNIRRFHKYQRNIEMANTLQVTPFDSATEPFPFESNATAPLLDGGQQINYSSSDSDSDDSDGNDLDDSDNSSCDECATGPCSVSILPPLTNGSTASSPAMSMTSYYNKNGEFHKRKKSTKQTSFESVYYQIGHTFKTTNQNVKIKFRIISHSIEKRTNSNKLIHFRQLLGKYRATSTKITRDECINFESAFV